MAVYMQTAGVQHRPRAIPHNVQNRKEEVTNLDVRSPQYERLHTFLLFTCRAVRCLDRPGQADSTGAVVSSRQQELW